MTKVAILGGYGLIGSACLRALKTSGFDVKGVGRSKRAGLRCNPSVPWAEIDIAKARAGDWLEIFADVDVVVNAAGALQDGARDNLRAIHEAAIGTMIEVLRDRDVRFVQIRDLVRLRLSGFPAFSAVLGIVWLMVAKPAV